MASFNAIDLGPVVYMQTEAEENELQTNAYPGVNGLEILDMGSRGGTTRAQGACIAVDLPTLATTEQTFRSMQVATPPILANLIDTEGTNWSNVRLRKFTPVGPIEFLPGVGWGRQYEMTFLHAE